MAKYSIDNYDIEELYAYQETNDERLAALYDKNIIKYRTKTIKSGDIVECMVYPVWNTRSALTRATKTKESRETQKRLNKKNAISNIIRLVNTNFTDADIWGTFTYETKKLPKSVDAAQSEFGKFIRRLRYRAEKHNFPPLKYVYTTEFEDDEKKGKHRVHHHIVVNFPDRDLAEQLWRNGARKHTRRLQADDDGYEGLVRYITKDPCGKKRYVTSRNLEKPQITVADYKFSRRKVSKIMTGKLDPTGVFEKMYDYKYRVTKHYTKTSEYCTGAYLYTKLVLKDKKQKRSTQNYEIHRE